MDRKDLKRLEKNGTADDPVPFFCALQRVKQAFAGFSRSYIPRYRKPAADRSDFSQRDPKALINKTKEIVKHNVY